MGIPTNPNAPRPPVPGANKNFTEIKIRPRTINEPDENCPLCAGTMVWHDYVCPCVFTEREEKVPEAINNAYEAIKKIKVNDLVKLPKNLQKALKILVEWGGSW